MWGWFIGLFVVIWLVQFVFAHVQMKHYRNTVKKMSDRSSGFLGVGFQKRRLGIGSIVILVSDEVGKVIDAKIMKGVTVFARFKKEDSMIDLSLNNCKEKTDGTDLEKAVNMATENIEKEMKKFSQKKEEVEWIS